MTTESDTLKALIHEARVRNSNNAVTACFSMLESLYGNLTDAELIYRWQVLRLHKSFYHLFMVLWCGVFGSLVIFASTNYTVDPTHIPAFGIFVGLPLLVFAFMIHLYRKRNWNNGHRHQYGILTLLLRRRGYSYLTE